MAMRPRILPVTMIAGFMLLGIKVGDLVRGGEMLSQHLLVASVGAQESGSSGGSGEAAPAEPKAEASSGGPESITPPSVPATPTEEKPAGEEAKPAVEGEAKLEEEKKAEEEKKPGEDKKAEGEMKPEDGEKPAEGEDAKGEKKDGKPVPTMAPLTSEKKEDGGGKGLKPNDRYFSPVELELLQSLAKRREELDKWEQNIDVKENLMANAEKRIDEKMTQIESMKTELREMLAAYNDQENTKIKSLVKIYESMKPRDAARIFDEVEMPILLLVIDKMAEKKAAPILAAMDPKKAKQLTVELAERRRVESSRLSPAAANPVASPPVVK